MADYLEAIEAIEERPTVTCAYRAAWPKHDCIKMIGNAPKPFRRKTRLNTKIQSDWAPYEPSAEDIAATDWDVLDKCAR